MNTKRPGNLKKMAIAALALLLGPAVLASLELGAAKDFAILGLEGGTVSINSGSSVTGNIGYSDGVTSTVNQKLTFDGAAYVHSGSTGYDPTQKDWIPLDGLMTGPTVDAKLDAANVRALDVSSTAAALGLGAAADVYLGVLGDNDSQTVNSVGDLTVVGIDSLNFKEDYIKLVGDANDTFVINVTGNFSYDSSSIILEGGVTADHVLWNFPNASVIDINKSSISWNGTILAPSGSVEYHNPGVFNGSILALNITAHSDFSMNGTPFVIPEPGTILGGALASVSVVIGMLRFGRKSR